MVTVQEIHFVWGEGYRNSCEISSKGKVVVGGPSDNSAQLNSLKTKIPSTILSTCISADSLPSEQHGISIIVIAFTSGEASSISYEMFFDPPWNETPIYCVG